jgi:hypothetical protein
VLRAWRVLQFFLQHFLFLVSVAGAA